MSHTAILSGYNKDCNGSLRKVSAKIGIDPEGVTEEDVQLFRDTVMENLFIEVPENDDKIFVPTLLIAIPGGKA
jgi:hypothetical protein